MPVSMLASPLDIAFTPSGELVLQMPSMILCVCCQLTCRCAYVDGSDAGYQDGSLKMLCLKSLDVTVDESGNICC